MQNLLKKWYIVYTRPKSEQRVIDLFSRRKIEHYFPILNPRKQSIDQRKTGGEPLLTSYIFVRLHESQLTQLCETDDVISLVHWLNEPVIVDDEEIRQLKRFLQDFSDVSVEKTKTSFHNKVRFFGDNLLVKKEGNFLEIKETKVTLSLPSIGYKLVANIKHHILEIMEHMKEL